VNLSCEGPIKDWKHWATLIACLGAMLIIQVNILEIHDCNFIF
jgi:hypothetical protein